MEIKQQISKIPCVKEEVTREIRKYFDINEDKNPVFQNVWNAAKAVVRRKSIGINDNVRKKEMIASQ